MTSADDLVAVLREGEMSLEGRLLDSSNAALVATCSADGVSIRVVYKPMRGERPLWDFATATLSKREVAMSLLDSAFGWGLVPTTVWREDAPMGPGSVQLWVDVAADPPPVDVVDARAIPTGWHTVAEGEGARGDHVCLVHEESESLRRLAILDVVANNADRKGGHVLRSRDGAIAGIDHGLTFHAEDKLRTVLWGWAGEVIDAATSETLARVISEWSIVERQLRPLLAPDEVTAARHRAIALADGGVYPEPAGAWPALPWPAM